MKTVITLIVFLFVTTAFSGELTHTFNSPSFSGNGYSSHILTIEQLEQQRKQKIQDDKQTKIDKELRVLKSTNAYKFKNNLESRIYAQLSKQIADSIFGENSNVAVIDGEWYASDTPFGDNVSWKRENGRIYVIILDSNGDTAAEFDVPVGEFAF